MVEINNQHEGRYRYAIVRGTDNGRQKTRNHGYDVIVGGEAIYWCSNPALANLPVKTQISRRRTLPASFPLVWMLPATACTKTSLRKVRTLWHCSLDKAMALLPLIDR